MGSGALKKLDEHSSLAWIAFAVFICVESLRLPIGSWRDPGAGFLPLGMGLILGGLSITNFLDARRRVTDEPQKSWYSRERWRNLVVVLAALVVYIFALEYMGFLVSTFILIIFLMRAIEPQKWVTTLAGAVVGSGAFYVLFELWLKVQLPRGIWGF